MGITNFTSPTQPPTNNNPGNPPFNMIFSAPNEEEIDITEIMTNLNETNKNEQPVMYRDAVINQIQSILIGKDKPNALLIGPAGVGKTKIVKELARRIANNDPTIIDTLKTCTIWELQISSIIAGTKMRGSLEKKAQAILDYFQDKTNNAILFMDEIHQLSEEKCQDIAQILKPAMADGSIKIIGATTLQEANSLTHDPAFNRRFSSCIVDELTVEQTINILKKTMGSYFMHYGGKIKIDTTMLPTVVNIADKYKKAGSHRPDNAITLLDRTIGNAVVEHNLLMQQVIKSGDQTLIQSLQSQPYVPITEKHLKTTAIQIMTGNAKKHSFDKNVLADKLSAIKGQDNCINTILEQLYKKNMALFPKKRPFTLMFAGPSGVGKTETTKIIAEYMTDKEPIILNMTEYNSPASINRIIGSPAGYVGSDSNSELPFDILMSNPYQVILLDEFEKCDKSVQRLFMSAFDEGTLQTNRGTTVDFSKAIIIATTNAGQKKTSSSLGFTTTEKSETDIRKETVEKLSVAFDTELLNRFECILEFNTITEDIYKIIIKEMYEKETKRINSEQTTFVFPEEIPDKDIDTIVQKTYIPAFGARPVRKAIESYIYDIAIKLSCVI